MVNTNLDTTPLPPNNLVAQDPVSAELAGYVRTKTFGRDVRESIARSIELNSTRSKSAEILANETLAITETATTNMANQVELIQSEKDAVIANATVDSEVILARPDSRGDAHPTLADRLNSMEKVMRERGVNILDFKQFVENKEAPEADWIWTIPFEKAVQKAVESKVKTVILPHNGSEYKMAPFDFNGMHGLQIIGIGYHISQNTEYYPSMDTATDMVRVRFISPAEVGFKFAYNTTTETLSAYYAHQCSIENIWLHGNNLVDTCINGTFGLEIKNCMVTHAKFDGVTFEGATYPGLIRDSEISLNGRHGLYVKGPMTTVYNLDRVNLGKNGGYGALIESGHAAVIRDVTAQSNRQGGVKVVRANEKYQAHADAGNYYLENILFQNLYTENNGLLETSDPNYEGNWGLLVTSDGVTSTSQINEPRSIRFDGGAVNASPVGQTYYLQKGYGIYFNMRSQEGKVEGQMGLQTGTSATFVGATKPYPFLNKYKDHRYQQDGLPFEVWKGGLHKQRGNVIAIPFVATLTNSNAGQTIEMKISGVDTALARHGYPLAKGSVVGLRTFYHGNQVDSSLGGSGTMKFSVIKRPFDTVSYTQTFFKQNIITATIAGSTNYHEAKFEPFTELITNETVGVMVQLSSDFTIHSTQNTVLAWLLVETEI